MTLAYRLSSMLPGLAIALALAGNAASATPGPEGTWSTGCWGSSGTNLSFEHSVIYGDAGYVMTGTTYVEQNCASPVFTTEERGGYVVGAPLASPAGAVALDQTVRSYWLTLRSQDYVDYYNERQYCGASDWALEVPKDITGRECGGNDYPAAGDVYYDFYVVAVVDGEERLATGYYDEDHDGTTADRRPVEIGSVYGRVARD